MVYSGKRLADTVTRGYQENKENKKIPKRQDAWFYIQQRTEGAIAACCTVWRKKVTEGRAFNCKRSLLISQRFADYEEASEQRSNPKCGCKIFYGEIFTVVSLYNINMQDTGNPYLCLHLSRVQYSISDVIAFLKTVPFSTVLSTALSVHHCVSVTGFHGSTKERGRKRRHKPTSSSHSKSTSFFNQQSSSTS